MTPLHTLVVVPCFDEAGRLDGAAFESYLDRDDRVGFVFVDDGSRDGTADMLREIDSRWPGRVRVVSHETNRGKGEAVRSGMLSALEVGPMRAGYWDADLATPLDAIAETSSILDDHPEVDLVMGARVALLGRRIERRASRHYLGRVFATAASVVLGLPVYDTQCGAKMFRVGEHTKRLFEAPFTSRWVFDVEILARYLEAHGTSAGIYELPLRQWRDVGTSKVQTADFIRAAGDLAVISRRYPVLRKRAGVVARIGRTAPGTRPT